MMKMRRRSDVFAITAAAVLMLCAAWPSISGPLSKDNSRITEQARTDEQLDNIQKILSVWTKTFIDESETGKAGPSAVTAGITAHDGRIRLAAAGARVAGGSDAVSADNVMRVGSQTKTYTTTVILNLISHNRLSLDDTIASLDKNLSLDLTIPEKAASLKNRTVKDMLEMTSQVEDYLHVGPYTDPETNTQYSSFINCVNDRIYQGKRTVRTPLELINLGFSASPEPTVAGYDGTYSNTNCTIMALAAEKITGKSLDVMLSDDIFSKLNIGTQFPLDDNLNSSEHQYVRASNYTPDSAAPSVPWHIVDIDARSKKYYHDTTSFDASISWAAGAVAANIPDQLAWLRELTFNKVGVLSSDIFDQRVNSLFSASKTISAISSPAAFDRTTRMYSTPDVRKQAIIEVAPVVTDYGYGVYRATSPATGNAMRGHGGSITGYTSLMFWLEDIDTGLVFNTAGSGFDSSGVYTSIAYPFWESEMGISRYLSQAGKYENNRIIPDTTKYSDDSHAGWTRGIVRLETIEAADGLEVLPSGRRVTYSDPSIIYLDAAVKGKLSTSTLTDPSLSYYGWDGSKKHGAIHVANVNAHIQAGANVSARGTNAAAVLVDSGLLTVDGEAAAWGAKANGVALRGGSAVIGKGAMAWAQGWQAAGLEVSGGSAKISGTAEGSHQAFGLKLTGGSAVLEDGGTATASTCAGDGGAVGAFVQNSALYAHDGSKIDAPYNHDYDGGKYNAALWLAGSGKAKAENGSNIGNSELGYGVVMTGGKNDVKVNGELLTNGYAVWGDDSSDTVLFGPGSEMTGRIDMGGACECGTDSLTFNGAELNLIVNVSGDAIDTPICGTDNLAFEAGTVINFTNPELLVGKSFSLFDESVKNVSGLSNIKFGNVYASVSNDGTVKVTGVRSRSDGSSGGCASAGCLPMAAFAPMALIMLGKKKKV